MPRYGGTFSQAGKPCRVPGEHFPRRENLAAFRGNIFPGGKTLPRSRGTFSQAGKPCRATGEHFPERGNLAAFQGNIFPSGETLPQSFPVRSRQGVCDTPLQFLRETFHDLFLFAHFKAYAIRPYSFCGNFPRSFPVSPLQGVCDTPLHLFDNHQGFIE